MLLIIRMTNRFYVLESRCLLIFQIVECATLYSEIEEQSMVTHAVIARQEQAGNVFRNDSTTAPRYCYDEEHGTLLFSL